MATQLLEKVKKKKKETFPSYKMINKQPNLLKLPSIKYILGLFVWLSQVFFPVEKLSNVLNDFENKHYICNTHFKAFVLLMYLTPVKKKS